jgi:hypothetical protein
MGEWLNTLFHTMIQCQCHSHIRHCNVAIRASAVVIVERIHRRVACC